MGKSWAFLIALLCLTQQASAQTITYVVDCSKGQTINRTLSRPDRATSLVVRVRGTCNEFVTVSQDNVTLIGDPEATIVAPDSTSDVIAVNGNGVTLENLTLSGGYYGIRNNQVFRLSVRNCVIQDTASDGIRVFVGDTRIAGSTIQRAGGNGLYVTRGGSATTASNTHVLNNANAGIYAHGNSAISVSGSTISGNVTGVHLGAGSEGTITNTTISENSEIGVTVASSQAIIGGGNVVNNNRAWGVWVYSGSMATIYGNTIEGNDWDGVSGDIGATMVMNENQIRQNGGFGIACRTNCTLELNRHTLENNAAGGVLIERASKLVFIDSVNVTGDGYGLLCGDSESSVGDIGYLNGTFSDSCTDFND